jgi:hypothetical protein
MNLNKQAIAEDLFEATSLSSDIILEILSLIPEGDNEKLPPEKELKVDHTKGKIYRCFGVEDDMDSNLIGKEVKELTKKIRGKRKASEIIEELYYKIRYEKETALAMAMSLFKTAQKINNLNGDF